MENEGLIRLTVFLTLFLLFAGAERLLPRRPRPKTRNRGWVTNWAIVVLDTITLRLLALLLPLLAVGAAIDAQDNGWGLFNIIGLPLWVEFIIAILVLDFLIWAQHWLTHKVPLLWRLHQVHHADEHIDVTTAIRFHPIEIAFSMMIKIGAVYLLGPHAWAVVIFEVMLNGTAMFNHANIHLSEKWDRWLRRIIVTPDMHRVHHSVHRHEHDTNYGFALSIWDRMFGTYLAEPAAGHDDMTVGLRWQNAESERLGWSLMLPFKK